MKNIVACIFSLMLMGELSFSQINDTISAIRMNFAVPDAPAFKILGSQPDNIMRPATTQELTVSLSDPFINSNVPSALAMEFSPYLLISGSSLTLHEYQNSVLSRILYHARVSIGTQRTATGRDSTALSFGLRCTLLDESDLRLDTAYTNALYAYNDTLLRMRSDIRDHYRGPGVPPPSDEEARAAFERKVDDSMVIASQSIEERIKKECEQAVERNWNKPIVEVGIAIAGASQDSEAMRSIQSTRAALWFVGAGRIDAWGQWVLGLNAMLSRTAAGKFTALEGSLSGRLYAGKNAYKGFLHAEADIHDDDMRSLMMIGGEMRLYKVLWLDCGAGIQKDGSAPVSFTSTVNIRLGTP